LEVQNTCLLLKLMHRLHSGSQSSWANWIREHVCLANLEGDIQGNHWELMRELLPLYQAITTVQLGDGKSTSFWHDVWAGDESIAEQFPALYSHCRKPNQPVHLVVAEGLRHHLVPRLTAEVATEPDKVNDLLS